MTEYEYLDFVTSSIEVIRLEIMQVAGPALLSFSWLISIIYMFTECLKVAKQHKRQFAMKTEHS